MSDAQNRPTAANRRGTARIMNSQPHQERPVLICILLAVLIFSAFCLTSSNLRFGYEGFNIAEAEAWVTGKHAPPGKSGLIEIAAYLPSAYVKAKLAAIGKLYDIQWLAYAFVQPFVTTLMCLVFFGFCRDLYGRLSTPSVLTLILAFTTMVWPYSKFGMENHQSLWTLAAVWSLFRYSREPQRSTAAALSLSLAALALTKMTGVLLCAALIASTGWLVLTRGFCSRRGFAAHSAIVLFVGLVGLAIFLLSNRLRYGGWLFTGRYSPYAEIASLPLVESVAALLISPGKSIFLFSPPLVIGLFYYGCFLRRFPAMRVVFVAMAVTALWYITKVRFFNDETWGPRRLHFLVPLMCLPLGCWWERRRETSIYRRWSAYAIVVLGLFFQLPAVSFDYTSHAFALGKTPLYSIDNNVWLPQLNALRFNLHLCRSLISKHRGAGSIDFVYAQSFCPWDGPDTPPPPLRFDVSKYDHLDLWYLQQQAQWPKPYWFRFPASYIALGLAALFIVAIIGLIRFWPRGEPMDSLKKTPENPRQG